MSYGLMIRQRDGKCQAVDDQRKPLTGWCKDAMTLHAVMRRKKKRKQGDG